MKSDYKIIGILLLSFFIVFYGLNCDKKNSTEPEDVPLTGTWKSSKLTIIAVDDVKSIPPIIILSSPQTMEVTVTLKQDSTFDFTIISMDSTVQGTGQWEESGGVIKIKLPEELNMSDLEGAYEIDGDIMTVPTVQTYDIFGTGEAKKYDMIIEFKKQ